MKIYENIIDVINKKIFKGFIRIENSRIAELGEEDTEESRYIMPGFTDSHIHIESSMLIPSRFAEAAVRHGTVSIVADPHEIANVMGIEGVEFMIENSKTVPLKFYFGAPSCVPATEFESSGGKIDSRGIRKLLEREDIKFLSEMMNFPGVINEDREVISKLGAARDLGKPVDGHAPGLRGMELEKYVGSGISTDHESLTLEEAIEKIRRGMKIQIREGSAARSLDRFHSLLDGDLSMLMLCSDDLHPEMLARGHIDILVRRLLDLGHDIFSILQVAVINPVLHYKLDTGLLREGDSADFIIIDNPRDFSISATWINGERVYDGRSINFQSPAAIPVNRFNCTHINPGDIAVKNKNGRIRVIDAVDGDLVTGVYEWEPESTGEYVCPDTGKDILKLIVKDRYNDSAPAVAFIRGFGIKNGAFASSIAHDSHNIIAVGCDDESICRAVNEIVEMKGGLAACNNREIRRVRLEIAGIMSDVPCGTLAGEYEEISAAVKEAGCKLESPFMALSFMALLVIPELKLGDKGLFDVKNFRFTELFI